MYIQLKNNFKKQYKKLPIKLQKVFQELLTLFQKDPFNHVLNNHAFAGKYKKCRSINISGDLRAIYTTDGDVVIFLMIGTHSELYS